MKPLREFLQHHTNPFAIVLVGAFAIAIYAYVLPLPFFRDDMVMLLWLRDMPWGKLWVDATGFPYYRPLSFSTLKLSELVFGWPEPISLHILNLVLHAANSAMVALLAGRFFEGRGKRVAAISAGLLFAAYPFSYEVIPTTGPIFQLQAAFFGLGAALCYANFKSPISTPRVQYPIPNTQSQKWLWLSLALALLGTFTCEYGVIIPAFIVLVEVMLWWQNRLMMNHQADNAKPAQAGYKLSLIPFAYFIFSAIYLAIWVIVPKSRAEQPLILQGLEPALKDMPVTALYYLQGLTYPLQTLGWPLVRATGASNQLVVGLIAAITLAVIVAAFVRAKRWPLLMFALAWFAVAIAPMWPTLNADYTLNGPRLHYLPSIGTTIIWGSVVALVWNGIHHRDAKCAEKSPKNLRTLGASVVKITGAAILAVTLVQSLVFLRGMADIITIGGRLTADVSCKVAAGTCDEPTLIVNFPSWLGKKEQETTFALGAEGISFLPGYSSMQDLVRLNTRQTRSVNAVTFTNPITEWKYDQRLSEPLDWDRLLHAMLDKGHVWMVEYQPNTLRLREAGWIDGVGALRSMMPIRAIFDERVQLNAAGVNRQTTGELIVRLTWTTVITVEQQWTAFVHVYNGQGQLVAQQDGYPLLGLAPPWLVPPGYWVAENRYIALPPDLPSGNYTIGVGLYDAETSQRIPAVSPRGERFENDVYLFQWPIVKR